DGEPLNAFESGGAGFGLTFKAEEGTLTAGRQWNDTNNHQAAQSFALNHALHTLMLSVALTACPNDSPVETVFGFYENTLPDSAAYKAEVESFRSCWRELQQRLKFLRLCENLARNDPSKYARSMQNIYSTTARNKFIETLDFQTREAAAAYIASV